MFTLPIYAFGDSFNEKCGADGVREKVLSRYDALPGSLTGESLANFLIYLQ